MSINTSNDHKWLNLKTQEDPKNEIKDVLDERASSREYQLEIHNTQIR